MHGETDAQRDAHTHLLTACTVMSPCGKWPAPPCHVVVFHVYNQMPTDMKYDVCVCDIVDPGVQTSH